MPLTKGRFTLDPFTRTAGTGPAPAPRYRSDSRFTRSRFTTGGFTDAVIDRSHPPVLPTVFWCPGYGSSYGWSLPPPLHPVYIPTPYGSSGYGGAGQPAAPIWSRLTECPYGLYPYGGFAVVTEIEEPLPPTPPPPLPPGRLLHVSAGIALDPLGGMADRRYTQTGQPSPIVPTRAMPKHPPVVYVLDATRKMIAALDGYQLWEWTAHWRHPHECYLMMNARLPGATELITQGRYLMAWTEGGELRMAEIESIEGTGGEDGVSSETIEVRGRDYALHFEGRVALSNVLSTGTGGYDTYTKTGGTAAQAMYYYVWQNTKNVLPAGSVGASLQSEFRVLQQLDLAAPPAVDARLEYSARFQYLSEVLYEIGLQAGLGYQVVYNRATDRFVFSILTGRHVAFPPVVSLERGTAASITFSRSVRDTKTYAIVAGQGEGAARTINGTFDIPYLPPGGPFPNYEDRKELFVDARDCDRNSTVIPYGTALQERGFNRLAEFRPEETIEAELSQTGLLDYPRDIRLGDVLIVEHPPYAEIAARLVGVVERYTADDGRTVSLVIGSEPADLTTKTVGLNRRRGSIYRL